jgi:hypothetical protein
MSAVKVEQVWRYQTGAEWKVISGSAGNWECECLKGDGAFLPGDQTTWELKNHKIWTLISGAPAAAELAPGEYIECYDGEKWVRCKHKRRNPNSLSEICGHYHSRWAKEPAAPPVAERAPPKCEVRHPDVVSCTTDVLSRVYPVGRRYACSSCYRARESDIAIHMQGTMGGRHYQEPLPTDHWRAPDLLARPWLYRGSGR